MTENSNIALGNSFRKTVFFAALVEVGCFLVQCSECQKSQAGQETAVQCGVGSVAQLVRDVLYAGNVVEPAIARETVRRGLGKKSKTATGKETVQQQEKPTPRDRRWSR